MTDKKYSDVLYREQTLDNNEARQNFIDSVEKASEDDMNHMLEKSLKQPIMEEVYKSYNIKPQDVDKFIETVKASPLGHKKTMLTGIYTAYEQAAISEKHEDKPKIDGIREAKFALEGSLKSSKAISLPMEIFAQQQAEQQKFSFGKKIMRWVDKKIPGAKHITAGFAVAVIVTPALKSMLKIMDKQTPATELTAKDNTQDKTKDASKTLQIVPKNNQYQA